MGLYNHLLRLNQHVLNGLCTFWNILKGPVCTLNLGQAFLRYSSERLEATNSFSPYRAFIVGFRKNPFHWKLKIGGYIWFKAGPALVAVRLRAKLWVDLHWSSLGPFIRNYSVAKGVVMSEVKRKESNNLNMDWDLLSFCIAQAENTLLYDSDNHKIWCDLVRKDIHINTFPKKCKRNHKYWIHQCGCWYVVPKTEAKG